MAMIQNEENPLKFGCKVLGLVVPLERRVPRRGVGQIQFPKEPNHQLVPNSTQNCRFFHPQTA